MICEDEMTIYVDDEPVVLLISGEVYIDHNTHQITVEQLGAVLFRDNTEFQMNTAQSLLAVRRLEKVYRSMR